MRQKCVRRVALLPPLLYSAYVRELAAATPRILIDEERSLCSLGIVRA